MSHHDRRGRTLKGRPLESLGASASCICENDFDRFPYTDQLALRTQLRQIYQAQVYLK
jgi:hypothetical protein